MAGSASDSVVDLTEEKEVNTVLLDEGPSSSKCLEFTTLKGISTKRLPTRLSKEEFEEYSTKVAKEVVAEFLEDEGKASRFDLSSDLPSETSQRADFYALIKLIKELLQTFCALNEESSVTLQPKRAKRPCKKAAPKRGWVSGTGFGGMQGTDQRTLTKNVSSAKQKQRKSDLLVADKVQQLYKHLKSVLDNKKVLHKDYRVAALGRLFLLSLSQLGHVGSTSTSRRDVDVAAVRNKRGRSNQHCSGTAASPSTAMNNISLCRVLQFYWLNDSLMDVTDRLSLYSGLLDIVDLCGTSPAYTGLQQVLFAELPDGGDASSPNHSAHVAEHAVEDAHVAANSLLSKKNKNNVITFMKKLEEQSTHLLGNFQDSMQGGQKSELADVLAFIQRLQESLERTKDAICCNPFLQGQLDLLESVSKSQRRDLLRLHSSQAIQKDSLSTAYVEALKGLQFRTVVLLDLVQMGRISHAYAAEALQDCIASGPSAKTRLLRIGKEMSTMATSLPLSWESGIFIRADEFRPDVMCALILGPAGTPYANGSFVFDIYLRSAYPQIPPKVMLKTTGYGTMRFNPNLYACGKVCLSLLGTWTGPGWNPAESTLLQVLVSIQSLIMVEQPYFNEPGYESQLGTPVGRRRSKAYNESIRVGTLRFAIFDAICNPHYLFQDVIKLHYSLKHQEIRSQLEQWIHESSNATQIVNIARDLNRALDSLLQSEVSRSSSQSRTLRNEHSVVLVDQSHPVSTAAKPSPSDSPILLDVDHASSITRGVSSPLSRSHSSSIDLT